MKYVWFVFLALLCAAALVLSLLWMLRPEKLVPPQSTSAPQYLLKDSGGRLALFYTGTNSPVAVYDVYTRLLPEEDVLQLLEGIPVSDEAELYRLLEDFGL